MLCTYLRSSSIGAYDFCPHSYFINYLLDIYSPPNLKTEKGTIVHKVLEILAKAKLAQQNNEDYFNDEIFKDKISSKDLHIKMICEKCFEYYSSVSKHNWNHKDYLEIEKLVTDAIMLSDGMFNPLKRHIICPEMHFDININKHWAKYIFELPNKETIDGHLAIKGTIDLITKINDDTLEIIDWKTGRRWNWGKNKEKKYSDLCNDIQLRLYHYAVSKLYPQYNNIMLTIFFIRDGGPFTIAFGPKDIKITEDILRQKYTKIKMDTLPHMNKGWHCKSFCHYGKTIDNGSKKTICETVRDNLVNLGMDATITKYKQDYNFEYKHPGKI